jgi:hypothetical protein
VRSQIGGAGRLRAVAPGAAGAGKTKKTFPRLNLTAAAAGPDSPPSLLVQNGVALSESAGGRRNGNDWSWARRKALESGADSLLDPRVERDGFQAGPQQHRHGALFLGLVRRFFQDFRLDSRHFGVEMDFYDLPAAAALA